MSPGSCRTFSIEKSVRTGHQRVTVEEHRGPAHCVLSGSIALMHAGSMTSAARSVCLNLTMIVSCLQGGIRRPLHHQCCRREAALFHNQGTSSGINSWHRSLAASQRQHLMCLSNARGVWVTVSPPGESLLACFMLAEICVQIIKGRHACLLDQVGRNIHCDSSSSRRSGDRGWVCWVQVHKVDALVSYKADAEG